MIDYLIFCLLVSLFCAGLFTACNGEKMLLVPVANWLSKHLPEYFRKPLFECLSCMASMWTIVAWCIFIRVHWWMLLFAIPVVCGINIIISSLIKPLFDE